MHSLFPRWLRSDGQVLKMTLPWLIKEVASRKPQTHQEWDELATILSEVFSSDSNRVELKGRGCRERLTRLIEKNEQDDKKSLKK